MSKISDAIYEVHYMDTIASGTSPVHRVHPLAKLLVTIAYIWFTVSFDKYNVTGLITMVVYPVALFSLSEVSFKHSIKKLRIVLPFVVLIGIFNPIFDRTPRFLLYGLTITNGMVSGFALFIKAFLTVLASYLLIATTRIESICYALNILHMPDMLVTQILLTYRYITVLLSEANHIFEAYSLRAPFQKGIHYKVWGSLIGQLLFRSIDRASSLYDSMVLRGYSGSFKHSQLPNARWQDFAYPLLWVTLFAVLRYTNLISFIGNLFI
ncbi:MAG: cobalt ECF transporter T component CbiQ [Clostridiales bacterium]|jgi:cobalt/nickel transport system permease protein|nr:cobalt ECF transporter T component CbiQ [Clostridiales bacterium]